MAKYICKLALREYYELEIEANSYEEAVDIASDTDISEFTETGITTEQMEVEEVA